MYLPITDGWLLVVVPHMIPADGTCPTCRPQQYDDCPCPGPMSEGFEFEIFHGQLYAREMAGEPA